MPGLPCAHRTLALPTTCSANEVAGHPPNAVRIEHRGNGLDRRCLVLEHCVVLNGHVLPIRCRRHLLAVLSGSELAGDGLAKRRPHTRESLRPLFLRDCTLEQLGRLVPRSINMSRSWGVERAVHWAQDVALILTCCRPCPQSVLSRPGHAGAPGRATVTTPRPPNETFGIGRNSGCPIWGGCPPVASPRFAR